MNHKSLHAESAVIAHYFAAHPNAARSRYCVDVGAFDGVTGSNSRALFEAGWSGIAIDPDRRTFERLQALYADRPDIRCLQVALADYEGTVDLLVCDGPKDIDPADQWRYGQATTIDCAWADRLRRDYGFRYESVAVPVTTLNRVLAAAGAPADIGLLSIDCEGQDLIILSALDLSRWRPHLIVIETDRDQVPDALVAAGYRFHARRSSNAFFSRD